MRRVSLRTLSLRGGLSALVRLSALKGSEVCLDRVILVKFTPNIIVYGREILS